MTTYATPLRTVQIPTWTRGTVLKVWAAAALPMAVLAWVVAPLLARTFSGPPPFPSLILSLAAGLIWQFFLVLIVVRREQGTLRWPVVKAALWLNAPISPRTGKRSNRLWWMIIPLMALLALEEMLPALPTPAARDASALLRLRHRTVVDVGQLGLVRHPGRPVRLQHRARRRTVLPRPAAAPDGLLRSGRLGGQRSAVRAATTCTSRG